MSAPHVYRAISAVTAELARCGIPKAHTSRQEGYDYRSIDDVLNMVGPLLAKHKLCMLPRVMERSVTDERSQQGERLSAVSVTIAFDIVSSRDGSTHTIQMTGEALDEGDKATAKALSSAFKYAVLQTFCVPVRGLDDAHASSVRLAKRRHDPEPTEGWVEWTRGIIDTIGICMSEDALDRVQDRNRSLLTSLSRERADLYGSVGEAFLSRRAALTAAPPQSAQRKQEVAASPPGANSVEKEPAL